MNFLQRLVNTAADTEKPLLPDGFSIKEVGHNQNFIYKGDELVGTSGARRTAIQDAWRIVEKEGEH